MTCQERNKGDTETTHLQTVAWMATTNEKEIIP
eukprot:CAMPEP_0170917244 /NCGR_PEP_ID=MMETSP0735-20130129/7269_1 /TAXON_ID=186038 /ORGANISM="Fragilariopsis kerguelensis, Strain L26-C5" /LENGTH=32 /DNA_ID= /DNA_START= /DNA_END= /DNA_ORIENTATION=